MKKIFVSFVLVLSTAGLSTAAVNVDVTTPNASVRIGTPPPAPQVTVIKQERVVEKEHRHEGKDNGKHKGHKKNKKQHHDERNEHNDHRERK